MIVNTAQQQDDIVKLYKNSDSNVSNKPSFLVKYYLQTECVLDEDYTKHIDEAVNFIA